MVRDQRVGDERDGRERGTLGGAGRPATTARVTTWAVECGAPKSLMRRALNKNSIPERPELVMDGLGAKDGSNAAKARDITSTDGSSLFVGSSGTGGPYERSR